jgi:hypothetical protein
MIVIGNVQLGFEMMGLGMALVFAALLIITALIVVAERINIASIGKRRGKSGGRPGGDSLKRDDETVQAIDVQAERNKTDTGMAPRIKEATVTGGAPVKRAVTAAAIAAATRRYAEDTARQY